MHGKNPLQKFTRKVLPIRKYKVKMAVTSVVQEGVPEKVVGYCFAVVSATNKRHAMEKAKGKFVVLPESAERT